MKKSTAMILIVLGIILGGAGWWVKHRSDSTWKSHTIAIGEKLFGALPANDVAKLTIRTKNDQVILARKETRWVVTTANDYPADFTKVSDFVKQLVDLTPAQVVDVIPSDLGRLELNAPDDATGTGTDVELIDESGKPIAKIRLGKDHERKAQGNSPFGGGWPDGRYIMIPSTNESYLVSETFSAISDKASDWMDKTFVKVTTPKSIKVTKEGTRLWELTRAESSDAMTLSGTVPEDKEPDTGKISSVSSTLTYASFSHASPRNEESIKANGFNEVVHVAEFATFDGFTYWIALGKKNDQGELPVLVSVNFEPPAIGDGPEGESEDDKAEREKAHAEAIAESTKRFEREQQLFAGWIYYLPSSTAVNLLSERDVFLKDKPEPEEEPAE